MKDDPARLATVKTFATAFEAHTIAAVLKDAGVEAVVFDAVFRGLPLGTVFAVPVQVHAEDLDRARQILASTVADSVDLDWDEVDVGEREDDLPSHEPGRTPVFARIATVTATIALLSGAAWALLMLF